MMEEEKFNELIESLKGDFSGDSSYMSGVNDGMYHLKRKLKELKITNDFTLDTIKQNSLAQTEAGRKFLKTSQTKENQQNAEQLLLKHDVNQQRELLLAFCDHLNTYAGMEEVRFDFMMQDFLDKSQ